MIASYQTGSRSGLAKRATNVSFFDHVDVRKEFEEIDGITYPHDSVNINFTVNEHLDQHRDLK